MVGVLDFLEFQRTFVVLNAQNTITLKVNLKGNPTGRFAYVPEKES